MAAYEREHSCDWTSGSFLMVRREALMSAGLLDERFFIYSEETDLCLRIKRAGWQVRHLPTMTIVHHAGKGGTRPKMVAQDAYTRRQYARKHFHQPQRGLFLAAVFARHAVRAVAPGRGEQARTRRAAARRAMKTLCGLERPPFGTPPPTALAPVGDR
jgi:GT2 family glycosyltransferase